MIPKNLNFFVYFIFLSLCLSISSYKFNRNGYQTHLGSKSAYRNVANYNSSEIKYDGCRAVKLWGLIRHGTRYPSVELIEKMRTRLVDIKKLILESLQNKTGGLYHLELFKFWTPTLVEADEKKLTNEGEEEMLFLAERWQSRFPKLMGKIYSSSLYKFKHTQTQRAKKSAEAFAAGLFGRGAVRYVEFPEPVKNDPVLRFYKLCKKWRTEIKRNPAALKEQTKFQTSEQIAKVINAVNARLGLNAILSLDDVHIMYMVCAFETAYTKKKMSPWCSVFSLDDLKVMEYNEDLKYYWIDGYGYELTYKQACKARNDMVEFFHRRETFPKIAIYFTHSGTLLKMLTHMGLYKPNEHLKADDFSDNANRTWRVSYIDPFGTNLVFVLFNCQDGQKILTLHQEHIVQLPCCENSDLCSMKEFEECSTINYECLFDQMCHNKP